MRYINNWKIQREISTERKKGQIVVDVVEENKCFSQRRGIPHKERGSRITTVAAESTTTKTIFNKTV